MWYINNIWKISFPSLSIWVKKNSLVDVWWWILSSVDKLNCYKKIISSNTSLGNPFIISFVTFVYFLFVLTIERYTLTVPKSLDYKVPIPAHWNSKKSPKFGGSTVWLPCIKPQNPTRGSTTSKHRTGMKDNLKG
jgi:hypothetical protein